MGYESRAVVVLLPCSLQILYLPQRALLSLRVSGKMLEKSMVKKPTPQVKAQSRNIWLLLDEWNHLCPPIVGGDQPEGLSELVITVLILRWEDRLLGYRTVSSVGSPQLLGVAQAPGFTHCWFSNSTQLLQSRTHLNSEHFSLDLMWYFSLDPMGSVLLHCNFLFSSFPYVLHSCPRWFCHLNLSPPGKFFLYFSFKCAMHPSHWQIIISLSV